MESIEHPELKCAVCQRTSADSYYVQGGVMRCEHCDSGARRQAGKVNRVNPPTALVWQCPYCDHSIAYSAESRDTAEIDANMHLVRYHPNAGEVVVLPDAGLDRGEGVSDAGAGRAAVAETVSIVWRCQFCEARMPVPEDEHEAQKLISHHLYASHRYRVLPVAIEEEPVLKVRLPERRWHYRRTWRGSRRYWRR